MTIDRRSFLRQGGTLAAGAALGALGTVGVQNGLRRYGPVTLRTPFLFCKDPLALKSEIYSDERRDRFGIRVFETDEKVTGTMEVFLSALRETLRTGKRQTICFCAATGQKVDLMRLTIIANGKTVTFLVKFEGNDSHPFWMNRADILKVV